MNAILAALIYYVMLGFTNYKADLPLINDADSSQHSAIIDVLDGKDLVINGPPGTGKTVTLSKIAQNFYKLGKTVGDVVRAAGTTDDAETDSLFVLRADGSVMSKKDRGWFFGGGFESLAVMPGDSMPPRWTQPRSVTDSSRSSRAIDSASAPAKP